MRRVSAFPWLREIRRGLCPYNSARTRFRRVCRALRRVFRNSQVQSGAQNNFGRRKPERRGRAAEAETLRRPEYNLFHFSPFEFACQRGFCRPRRSSATARCAIRRISLRTSNFGSSSGGKRRLQKFQVYGQGGPARHVEARVRLRAGAPDNILWCGEFGAIRHAPAEPRENYMRDVISPLRENGIQCCVWNYLGAPNDGDRFSLVDDDPRKILSRRMLEIIRGEAK